MERLRKPGVAAGLALCFVLGPVLGPLLHALEHHRPHYHVGGVTIYLSPEAAQPQQSSWTAGQPLLAALLGRGHHAAPMSDSELHDPDAPLLAQALAPAAPEGAHEHAPAEGASTGPRLSARAILLHGGTALEHLNVLWLAASDPVILMLPVAAAQRAVKAPTSAVLPPRYIGGGGARAPPGIG